MGANQKWLARVHAIYPAWAVNSVTWRFCAFLHCRFLPPAVKESLPQRLEAGKPFRTDEQSLLGPLAFLNRRFLPPAVKKGPTIILGQRGGENPMKLKWKPGYPGFLTVRNDCCETAQHRMQQQSPYSRSGRGLLTFAYLLFDPM
jgi:hypothetical protein